jgi:hypothetical protein
VDVEKQAVESWDNITLCTIQALIYIVPVSYCCSNCSKGWTYKVLALASFPMYGGLVIIFLHVSMDHCFGVFFVAKSTVQRFMSVFVHASWESAADLENASNTVREFHRLKPFRPH